MNTENIRGFQHIGLPVKDLDATVRFYEGLGFQEAHRTTFPNGMAFVFLQLGSCMLEVYPVKEPAGKPGAIDHLCLDVTNIEAVYNEVVAAGHEILTKGVESAPFWEHGIRYFKIQGPDAEILEFCEILQ